LLLIVFSNCDLLDLELVNSLTLHANKLYWLLCFWCCWRL